MVGAEGEEQLLFLLAPSFMDSAEEQGARETLPSAFPPPIPPPPLPAIPPVCSTAPGTSPGGGQRGTITDRLQTDRGRGPVSLFIAMV